MDEQLATAPSYAGAWTRLSPPLTPWVRGLIDDMGFAQMTPVQASVIPLFLSHKDVIVEAVTGSGKTLSFVLPIIEMMLRRTTPLKKDQIGALIVTPTRELAIQIHGVLQTFLQAQESINGAQLVVGGKAGAEADYAAFKDTASDILVGTPGRLEELLRRKGVKKGELEVLVLDEADRLLDLGFSETLKNILLLLPKQRRTGLFSATMTDAISELARMGLRNPVRVVVKVENKNKEERIPASLQNMFQVARAENRMAQLLRVLRYEASEAGGARKMIVFFATCAQVNYFYKILAMLPKRRLGKVRLHSLHGKQTPARRTATFKEFVEGGDGVLLCTDVAARGLDLPDVDVVVQFDPPTDPKVFSHRCGRTARAGRRGRAITFLTKGVEENYVEFLQVKKIPLKPYPYLLDDLTPALEPETDDEARSLEAELRALTRQDRDLYDLSLLAFVSYVRSYSKHEANYIFRLGELDFAGLARSFALLRMPRMPETKGKTLEFEEEEVDLRTFAYKDKQREKQRLENLQKEDENPTPAREQKRKKVLVGGIDAEEAWSKQKERRAIRDLRKVKKERKKAYLKREAEEAKKKEEQGKLDQQEMQEWAEEEREAKRKKPSEGAMMGDFEDL